MIDWSVLGAAKRGLAVEGQDDKKVLEAFLDAGQKKGYWLDWRAKLGIEVAGDNNSKVFTELERSDMQGRLWGLIDRDWLLDTEIVDLQKKYPNLNVLPRIMIENYSINPDELETLLPNAQITANQLINLRAEIEPHLQQWLENASLWQVLHESDAHKFCRGNDGYPRAILNEPINEEQIKVNFERWHQHLEPASVLMKHKQQIKKFQSSTNKYSFCIHGGNFFNQIVVPALNKIFMPRPQDRNRWLSDLFIAPTDCPSDLIPILQPLVQP